MRKVIRQSPRRVAGRHSSASGEVQQVFCNGWSAGMEMPQETSLPVSPEQVSDCSSPRATTAALRLLERLAPVSQKLGEEGMFLVRLHGQRGQRKRNGERNVIAHGAGGQSASICQMGLIDPDGGFDESAQFRIIEPVLKLKAKPVSHRSRRTSLTWQPSSR